jgi:putative flippase GtrA
VEPKGLVGALAIDPRTTVTRLTLRAEHLWQRRHTPEAKQLFRYGMVSVISTVVAFTVLALVFGVLKLWGEVVSTVVANVVATFPAYVLNRRWVWGKSGRSHLMKEIVPFWGMQALGIAVSVVGASVARHVGIEHHLSHHQQTALVLVANLVSFGVFYVLKYMVFNRLFRVHTLQELDDLVEQQVDTARVSEAARELAAAVAEFDRRSATWTVVPACRPRPVPTLTPARGSR